MMIVPWAGIVTAEWDQNQGQVDICNSTKLESKMTGSQQKYRLLHFLMISTVVLVYLSGPSPSLGAEAYRFKRMWPTMKQPWYFVQPNDTAVDGEGNVYVADGGNGRIQKFTADGSFITKWGEFGVGAVAVDNNGDVYAADRSRGRILKFTADGSFIAHWGQEGTGDGEFDSPAGIAVDANGDIFVLDTWNNRIQKFTPDGSFITKWGSEGSGDGEFNLPGGIAVDANGDVYVADAHNNGIQKFTSDGSFITKWGNMGIAPGQFWYPSHNLGTDPCNPWESFEEKGPGGLGISCSTA